MELIKICLDSWPLAFLIFGIFFLFIFRKPILLFVGGMKEICVGNTKFSADLNVRQEAEKPADISKTEALANSFQSPMLVELENAMRERLGKEVKNPAEREKILIKHLAVTAISHEFERVYRVIFGSQISALQIFASQELVSPENLLPIYEQAKRNYTEFYRSISFDSWLKFLVDFVLMAQQGNKVGVTIRGKEFLKYLIDAGIPATKPF
jgi:hypothetical protein